MAHYNLIHVNLQPHAQAHPSPSPKNPPIKKGGKGEGEGTIPLASHTQWREKFLGGGEYISIPLKSKGGMLKIPRIEIVSCMEKLYQQRMLIDPSESQQGIYEEAKKLVVSRYLRKGVVKKFPRPSWVNPKYR